MSEPHTADVDGDLGAQIGNRFAGRRCGHPRASRCIVFACGNLNSHERNAESLP
jgi:hypothetical protein